MSSVFPAIAESTQLISNLEFAKTTRLRVTKLDRVRRVPAHLSLVTNGNDHILVAGHRAMLNGDLVIVRLQRSDHTNDATATPLQTLSLLLLGDVALRHHYDHRCRN